MKTDLEVTIRLQTEKIQLKGILTIPKKAQAIVVFAHGSGSGRLSPRNQYAAHFFSRRGLATLLLDLLTTEEESIDAVTREFRFDIPLLSKRLIAVADWLKQNPETNGLKICYFGSSTGAAAALIAAADKRSRASAVVSRGGRPDLARRYLELVAAPTLLIVGGNDLEVIELNQEALALLKCEKKLQIIPGASHLFEEPGKLEEAVRLSLEWFEAASGTASADP